MSMDAGRNPLAGDTAPGAPTGVSAAPGDTQATVTWTAPMNSGGTVITGYTVTAKPGGAQAMVMPGTSAVVMGLTNGTSYTFTVHATNAVGDGPESAASGPAVPGALPSAPMNVQAAPGGDGALVTWAAATTDGIHPVTQYVIATNPGGYTTYAPGTATAAVVGGLEPSTTYMFSVAAVNAIGVGPAATASGSVALGICGSMAAMCDPHATCADTPGSYTCTCNPHWSGDGKKCVPADCQAMNGGCDPNADCSTATGGIACTCRSPHWAGDGHACQPADCQTANGGCDSSATCSQSGGPIVCTYAAQTLRVEVPCGGTMGGLCQVNPEIVTSTMTLPGKAASTNQVQLHVRGVMEWVGCPSCMTQGWCEGTCGNDGFGDNVYSLQAGATTYVLNANAGTNRHPSGYDFTESFLVQGGTQLTLSANPEDSTEQTNNDGDNASGQPIVVPDIPPAPQPFDGQFVQVDVVVSETLPSP